MFKSKLILFLGLIGLCFADIGVDGKNRLDALLNKTNAIAKAHISLIEDRALLSTSLATLIASGYIDPNITNSNLYGGNLGYAPINVTDKLLDLNTNIVFNDLTSDERSYLLNNFKDSVFAREIYEKGGNFWVKYYYSSKAISVLTNNNAQNTYIGEAEPTSYSSVSSNQTWWDSNDVSFNVKKYVGTNWVNEDYNNQNLNPNGTFSNINTVPILKTNWNFSPVTSSEQTTTILCRDGSTYDHVNNRCQAFTSDACDGNTFDGTSKCYKALTNYCLEKGYAQYDNVNNICKNEIINYEAIQTSYTQKDASLIYSNCHGHTFFNYSSAKKYCDDLVEGGYSDWRLPLIGETSSHRGGGVPSCGKWTWTATKDSSWANNIRFVWNGEEFKSYYDDDSALNVAVRCVR